MNNSRKPFLILMLTATIVFWARGQVARGQDAPATQPAAAHSPMYFPNENDPWKAVLPGNITIELLGISENPSTNRPWWRPDGSPLLSVPDITSTGRANEEGKTAREILVKTDGLADSAGCTWDVDGRGAGASAHGHNYCLGVAIVSPELSAVTVDIGIASEQWKQLAAWRGGEAMGGKNSFVCADPIEKDGDIILTMTHDVKDVDMRVVAIDNNGQTHPAGRSSTMGVGDMKLYTFTFSKLAMVDVREFQFQTRRWQWVEFKNVAMKPGN